MYIRAAFPRAAEHARIPSLSLSNLVMPKTGRAVETVAAEGRAAGAEPLRGGSRPFAGGQQQYTKEVDPMQGHKKIPPGVGTPKGETVINHHKDISIIPCFAQSDKGVEL